MKVTNRNDNKALLAKKFLSLLEIKEPNHKQIQLMKSLLAEVGIVFFELSFAGNLTEQETACLFWITRGKSVKQIAKILNVSFTTIKTYFQRIKRKLNCTTMEQAVFEGIRYNYLQPKSNRK